MGIMGIHWIKLIVSIAVTNLAGLIGSLFTMDSVRTWYTTLQKPGFNPPNWVFGPVWTTLYVLMGISLYLVWSKGVETAGVKTALTLYGAQLLLNVLWSLIFFRMQQPFLALIEIIVLWAMILLTICAFYQISRPAAYLMIPYIIWVSFAAVLNFSIYWLNR